MATLQETVAVLLMSLLITIVKAFTMGKKKKSILLLISDAMSEISLGVASKAGCCGLFRFSKHTGGSFSNIYYHCGEEHRSLYQGFRCIEVVKSRLYCTTKVAHNLKLLTQILFNVYGGLILNRI